MTQAPLRALNGSPNSYGGGLLSLKQTLKITHQASANGEKQPLTRPMKIEYNAGLGCFKSPSTCESSYQKFRHLLDQ